MTRKHEGNALVLAVVLLGAAAVAAAVVGGGRLFVGDTGGTASVFATLPEAARRMPLIGILPQAGEAEPRTGNWGVNIRMGGTRICGRLVQDVAWATQSPAAQSTTSDKL